MLIAVVLQRDWCFAVAKESFENAFRSFVYCPEVANKFLNMARNLIPAFGGGQ